MKGREGLFSKNNYDIRFEEILEHKSYNDEAKSLVLNIIYKMESAYNDYKQVKPNVRSKIDIVGDIVETIKNRCDEIEIINPKQTRAKIQINRKNKIIRIFPNDNDLLQAMYFIKTPYTEKIDNVFDKAALIALENGMAINGAEIIRDFNGWSWNNVLNKEQEQYYNLLYQNLILLIGEDEIESIIKGHNIIDNLTRAIKNSYGKKEADEFMECFIKVCVLIFMNAGKKNTNEIFDYLLERESELAEISNKSEYISGITRQINENTELACKVDALLNNPKVLKKKYATKKISEKYKDIESYKISLIKYKNQVVNEINNQKKMMNPFEFVKIKKQITDEVNRLNELKEVYTTKDITLKSIVELQKKFIACFYKKIEVYDLKKELLTLVYEMRYYNCIYLGGKQVRQFKLLKNDIEKLQVQLVNKLKKSKIVDIFSSYERVNYYIIKYIFESRTIDLSKISFKYKIENGGIAVDYYDEKVVENSIHIKLSDEEQKGFIKKENKKMKIII